MKIAVFTRPEDADRIGAEILLHIVQSKAHPKLGLATGSSPVGIYRELVNLGKTRSVSFQHVSAYNLDEYIGLSWKHPQSYAAFMRDHLFKYIDIDPARIHIPDGTADSAEEECHRYEALLHEAGSLDVQLLGIGLNGHIGFNEPGTDLSCETHIVALTEETRRANAKYFSEEEPIPRHAITMGIGPIMRASKVLFIAHGKEKSSIVHQAFTGPVTTNCPGSLLQLHSDTVVLLDEEAAAELTLGDKPAFRMFRNKRIDFVYDPEPEAFICV